MIRPVGFVSKKDIGLRITEYNKLWWILVDALPMKINKRNTANKTPIALMNSNAEYIPIIKNERPGHIPLYIAAIRESTTASTSLCYTRLGRFGTRLVHWVV